MMRKVELLKSPAEDFEPRSVVCWDDGEKVPFIFLCLAFEMISSTAKTSLKTRIATNMLWAVMEFGASGDLLAVLCLSAYQISPIHEGGSDLGNGLVAEKARSSQTLMCNLHPLAVSKESGEHSIKKKKNHIKALLVAARHCEPKYLIRLLLPKSKLRIGCAKAALLDALGRAAAFAEKESVPQGNFQLHLDNACKIIAVDMVQMAHAMVPVYDRIVAALLSGGVWNLSQTCGFSLGIPSEPMLSVAAKSVSEIVKRYSDLECTYEYKYDGVRTQIHCMEDGSVEIYSRNLECYTEKYPDVILAVKRLKKFFVKSCAVDCEIVAYDRQKRKILPLQGCQCDSRKQEGQEHGKIVNAPADIHLKDSFEADPGFLQFATALDSSDQQAIQGFLHAAIVAGCEGLVVKTLNADAAYKPDHNFTMHCSLWDSLELVPIAGYYGDGKRKGVYGSFLLACYDSENEEFQAITKTGTGFTDEMLGECSAILKSTLIPKPKPNYRYLTSQDTPDEWFEPSEVWEIIAAGLTISPVYYAGTGIVDSDKGISLRAPCIYRIHPDKCPEGATTSQQVAEMYCNQ
ncbi:hypothetical protein Cgig2_027650 [Carnegiea gigantea]|uniref:ATP-dependent DNA ligase family profile domain-containing protein n=1 Tax=Carnegiea gigantea TaxID=171969 RepID=A0A9Q1GPJ3_9CARY|nr:hypothetical protein Cgig2_027650 [Carnegiea gigantea]